MNSSNIITEYLGLETSEPVIRHGEDVKYINYSNNQIDIIYSLLKNYVEKGFKSIAIICKDEEEAKKINLQLRNIGINIINIADNDTKYDGRICTITSYLAKGLEFDGVIISDASEKIYNSEKNIDMKLIYVSMTRALHELTVLYNSELVLPLRKELNKNDNKVLKK